jgi:hypothetical protein
MGTGSEEQDYWLSGLWYLLATLSVLAVALPACRAVTSGAGAAIFPAHHRLRNLWQRAARTT